MTTDPDAPEPVSNPALTLAVSGLATEPESPAAVTRLDEALRGATFLAAAKTDESDELLLLNCSDESGRTLLPVFTDEASMIAFVGPDEQVAVLPAEVVFRMGLADYDGVVVNAAGPEFTLPLLEPELTHLVAVS